MAKRRQTILVKEYAKPKQFRKDAKHLTKKGWHVIDTVEHRPNAGIARRTLFGFWSLVRPPKPLLVVTYERMA